MKLTLGWLTICISNRSISSMSYIIYADHKWRIVKFVSIRSRDTKEYACERDVCQFSLILGGGGCLVCLRIAKCMELFYGMPPKPSLFPPTQEIMVGSGLFQTVNKNRTDANHP